MVKKSSLTSIAARTNSHAVMFVETSFLVVTNARKYAIVLVNASLLRKIYWKRVVVTDATSLGRHAVTDVSRLAILRLTALKYLVMLRSESTVNAETDMLTQFVSQ